MTTDKKSRNLFVALTLIGRVWKGESSPERYRLVEEEADARPFNGAFIHFTAPDPVNFATWAWARGYREEVIDAAVDYIAAISTFEPFVPLPLEKAA